MCLIQNTEKHPFKEIFLHSELLSLIMIFELLNNSAILFCYAHVSVSNQYALIKITKVKN